MGHKTLADKLDQIQREDLGIHFDESMLWEELSASLGNKKTAFIERRLWIAACITLLILLFPIVLMMDTKPEQLALDSMTVQGESTIAATIDEKSFLDEIERLEPIKKVNQTPIYLVGKKGVSLALSNPLSFDKMSLKPIPIQKEEKIKRQLFANQDVSIIRASLGTPSIEKEKSVTLRAQLHTSSQPEQLNNQAFKIKLFDMSKQ